MQDNNSTKSKRIAKNTLVLYIRMLFLMAITLYTSRVILSTLGIDDYGIYNVVGGFVATFSIVCNALSGACSRFLNYEMGKGRNENLNKVFSSAITIHIVLAIIIALLTESFGFWFLNTKMVIPADRLAAANWCFHLSVLTFCTNLIAVPYRACIIAHERMKAFAYVSLYEGVAKLIISFAIVYTAIDRLVFYAILLCMLQFSVRFMYSIYCQRHFEECHYKLVFEKQLLKEIFSYSGWNFLGHASGILRNQGGNVLINLFFGPSVNAARGISNQVLHAVEGFVTNFTTAVNPQISQSYAAGDITYMKKLVYASARYSFYMLFFLSLPIIFSTDYILGIWLKETPENASLFVKLMLIYQLIYNINAPMQQAQSATGKIRDYQLVVATTQLLILPISYIWLKLGGSPATVFYVSIIVGIISVYLRIYMVSRIIEWDIWDYTKKVIFNVITVAFVSSLLPIILSICLGSNPLLKFLCISVICVLSTTITILFLGLGRTERMFLYSKIITIIKKK